PTVLSFVHTRQRQYWMGTLKGLCEYRPRLTAAAGNSRFVCLVGRTERSQRVNAVIEDHAGVVWAGTSDGLYQVVSDGGRQELREVALNPPSPVKYPYLKEVRTILEDRRGTLWIGTTNGLYRRWSDGRVRRYRIGSGVPGE